MSDRTSAAIFASAFDFLAERPDDRSRGFAKRLWDERTAYDFSDRQIGADEALIKLGLADKCAQCGYISYDGEDDSEHSRNCDGGTR